MKSLIPLSLIIMLCLSTDSRSQIRGYGIKIGAVSASQTWNYTFIPDFPTTNRWGIDVGAYVEWLDMSIISLCTELHFTERGVSEKAIETTPEYPEGTGNIFSISGEIDYLSLPVLLKARYNIASSEVYVLMGPRIDLKLGSREGFDMVYSHFRHVTYGPTLGAGILLQNILPHHKLGLEYRFSSSIGSEYSTPLLEVTSKSMEFLLTLDL